MPPDNGLIRAVRIGCDLNPANNALRNISNKVVCVAVIPFSRVVTHDEFLAGCNRQIGVLVAAQFVVWRRAPLGNPNSAPKLINLQCASLDVANQPVVKAFTFLPDGFQHAQDRVRVAIHKSGNGANAKPLCEQLANLHDLFMVNPQSIQRLRFGKCLPTADAAESTHDSILVSEIGEVLGFTVTA
jgi:hypothetical protein